MVLSNSTYRTDSICDFLRFVARVMWVYGEKGVPVDVDEAVNITLRHYDDSHYNDNFLWEAACVARDHQQELCNRLQQWQDTRHEFADGDRMSGKQLPNGRYYMMGFDYQRKNCEKDSKDTRRSA